LEAKAFTADAENAEGTIEHFLWFKPKAFVFLCGLCALIERSERAVKLINAEKVQFGYE